MTLSPFGLAARRVSSLSGLQGIWPKHGVSLLSFWHFSAEEQTAEWLQQTARQSRFFTASPSLFISAWDALKRRQIEQCAQSETLTPSLHCLATHGYTPEPAALKRGDGLWLTIYCLGCVLFRLLPSYIFQDQLAPHIFLGKEILQMSAGPEEAERLAREIDKEIESSASAKVSLDKFASETAATRGRTVSSFPLKELEDLDWSLLTAVQTATPEVSAVGQYLLQAPCKRFRPLLLLLLNRVLQVSAQRDVAAAVGNSAIPLIMVQVAELIHTASLMHDDVIDEASTRRGRPAAHSVFGNKRAILGGDFILARASSIAATTGLPEVCLRVSQMVESLVKGELAQALSSSSDIPKAFEIMLAKSYHKTASLMAESCACLALIGGYKREWVDWSHEMGASVGMAFQLYDDELDLLCSSQALGKPANNDLKSGVVTAPLLLAAMEHPRELLPLLQRRLREPGDAELAVGRIRDSAALPRAHLLSRLYIQHILCLLKRLPQKCPEQEGAAADLASLVLWATQRTTS